MTHMSDRSPAQFAAGMFQQRRRTLCALGGLAALGALGVLQLSPALALPPAVDRDAALAAALPQFMTLSAWLTGRPALDAALGRRYLAALAMRVPDLAPQLAALGAALKDRAAQGQQAYCDFIETSGAAYATLPRQILAAWYGGQVDLLPKPELPPDRSTPPQQGSATVVAYEAALMYAVTADVLAIPSYCRDVPGYWSQQPQEVRA